MIIHAVVKPSSKKDSIDVCEDGTLLIRITAAPFEGKANKYLLKYLAGIFKLAASNIEITKGRQNAYKTIVIHADEKYVRDVLAELKSNKLL